MRNPSVSYRPRLSELSCFLFLSSCCCLVLFGISLATALQAREGINRGAPARMPWLQFIQCEVYVCNLGTLRILLSRAYLLSQGYASALSLARIIARRHSKTLTSHLSFVLLVAAGVYVYRDILPLFVKSWSPIDASEGIFLWAKLSVLLIATAVIPLLVPRRYVPYDPSVSGRGPLVSLCTQRLL